VIVVDNASEDGSVEAARARFDAYGVRWLVQGRNLGFAGGVNQGFAAARQPLVLLLNTDVRTSPAEIEALCVHAESHPLAGVVGPRVTYPDGSFQESYWRFPSLWRLFCSASGLFKLLPASQLLNGERYAGRRFAEPTPVDAVSGCVFLTRRELVQQLGGLDEGYFMYFEETDFCRRVRDAGHQVHYAPVATFVHLLGGSSRLARRRNFLEFRRSLVRFHRKHGGRMAALVARALLLLHLGLRLPYWGLRSLLRGEMGKSARDMVGLHVAAMGDLLRWAPVSSAVR
jgi:GT2 family glycosyltransferase